MKTNWQTKKLGEVCELLNGFAFQSKDYVKSSNTMNFRMSQIRPGGGIDLDNNPKYLPDSFREKYKDYLLNDGDIVIAMTDMARETKILGVPAIVKTDSRKLLLNQRVGKLCKIDQIRIFIPFLRFVLTSPQINAYYKSLGRGGLQVNIGKQDILNAIIPLPSLIEQKHIVSILDEAFTALAKAKENAENNLQNSRELFESYLQNVFTDQGYGWEKKKLGDVCEKITKGSSPNWQGIKYVDMPGVLFVTSENVGNGLMLFPKKKYVEEEFNISDRKSILKVGDVLTNIVGASIGRTSIFDLGDNANINQAVCLLRVKEDFLYNRFLMNLLNLPYFKNHLHENEINNARANLSLGFFTNLVIPLPSLLEQRNIVDKIDAISAETKKLEVIYQQKLVDLDELKKSILQKAFNGELSGVCS